MGGRGDGLSWYCMDHRADGQPLDRPWCRCGVPLPPRRLRRIPSGMKPTRTKPAIPPLPAVVLAMISVQGGAALAKGLFPALGPVGTVGLRIGLSALILLAAFRPRLNRLTAAQWSAIIPYGVVLGVMN